jgi:hypothetical protein
LTFGLVPASVGVIFVAALETTIGVTLLTGRLLRFGLLLLGVAMVGILSPLVLLPETLFRGAVWAPTLAGQYVVKDVVLLAATLALASNAFIRQPLAPTAEQSIGNEAQWKSGHQIQLSPAPRKVDASHSSDR